MSWLVHQAVTWPHATCTTSQKHGEYGGSIGLTAERCCGDQGRAGIWMSGNDSTHDSVTQNLGQLMLCSSTAPQCRMHLEPTTGQAQHSLTMAALITLVLFDSILDSAQCS